MAEGRRQQTFLRSWSNSSLVLLLLTLTVGMGKGFKWWPWLSQSEVSLNHFTNKVKERSHKVPSGEVSLIYRSKSHPLSHAAFQNARAKYVCLAMLSITTTSTTRIHSSVSAGNRSRLPDSQHFTVIYQRAPLC